MIATLEHHGECTIVVVGVTELDQSVSDDFRREVFTCMDGGVRRLVIDLTRVSFLDSMGLGSLVAIRNRTTMEDGGMLALCGVGEQVGKVLAITSTDRLLGVHPDCAAALASLGE
jgi:anti-anti-sigma factor